MGKRTTIQVSKEVKEQFVRFCEQHGFLAWRLTEIALLKFVKDHQIKTTVLDCETTVLDCETTVLDRETTVPSHSTTVLNESTTVLDCETTVLDRETTVLKPLIVGGKLKTGVTDPTAILYSDAMKANNWPINIETLQNWLLMQGLGSEFGRVSSLIER